MNKSRYPLLPTPILKQTLQLKYTRYLLMILPDIWGTGYHGRCLKGVNSMKGSQRLTIVTGSSSVHQFMERIILPVLPHYLRK